MNTLANHAAFKLGKGARDLKHEPAGRRPRVDRLLVQEQVNTAGFERLDRAEKLASPLMMPAFKKMFMPLRRMGTGFLRTLFRISLLCPRPLAKRWALPAAKLTPRLRSCGAS
jgi:hypothetical protein